MVARKRLDRIRNGDFGAGGKAPTSWRWQALAGAPTWRFCGDNAAGQGRRLILEGDSPQSVGQWSQSFRCCSKHYYRLEVRACCRAAGDPPAGGLGLRLRCYGRDGLLGESERCYGPWRSSKAAWWRVQYRTPAGATRLEVALRLEGMGGTAEVDRVRAIPMDYTCVEPHPLSVPPWPHVYSRPAQARRITLVDGAERGGRLAAILRARFGAGNVRVTPPDKFPRTGGRAEAIIVSTIDTLPKAWTWDAVLRWAEQRVVVLSLPAFAQVVNRRVRDCVGLREHVQQDDTLGAKVEQANFMTNGLALLDVFDFSVFDESEGSFRQRQIIRGPALRQFMQSQSIEMILSSDTNMDHSSGRPLSLYKETRGGGLVVLDVDPLLSPMTNDQKPNTAAQLLMNVLGADTVSMGQLADPELSDGALLEQLRSMARQIPGVHLVWAEGGGTSGSKGPAAPQPALVVGPVGDQAETFPLPGLVVRTGLDQGGRFGVEGACVWVKSLVRPEPCPARHAAALLRRRRVVWVPFGRQVNAEQLHTLAGGKRAAVLIDVQATERNELRVVVPERSAAYEPYFELLGPLDRQLRRGRMFGWFPPGGALVNDLDHYAWRDDQAPLEVIVEAAAFAEEAPGWPAAARRVRLEVPASYPPTPAQSLLDTERLGLLLEWIAGLEIGLVAVNRDPGDRRVVLPVCGTSMQGRIIGVEGQARPLKPAEVGRLDKRGLRLGAGETLLLERVSK